MVLLFPINLVVYYQNCRIGGAVCKTINLTAICGVSDHKQKYKYYGDEHFLIMPELLSVPYILY